MTDISASSSSQAPAQDQAQYDLDRKIQADSDREPGRMGSGAEVRSGLRHEGILVT